MKNIATIELIRGVAALMVMLFHFGEGTDSTPDWYHDLFGYCGLIGVVMFFVVSGFVIPLQLHRREYKLSMAHRFLANRVVRIYPAFFTCLVLAVFLLFVQVNFIQGEVFEVKIKQVVANIILCAPYLNEGFYVAVFWTLLIEFSLYLFLSLTNGLLFCRGGLSFLMCVVLFSWLIVDPVENNRNFFHWLPHFGFGFSLFKFLVLRRRVEAVILLALCCLALCKLYENAVAPHLLPCVASLILMVLPVKSIPKFWAFLGMISYSLYLFHNIIGRRFFSVFERLIDCDNDLVFMINIALSCIVSILFSYFVYHFIEKRSHELSKKVW